MEHMIKRSVTIYSWHRQVEAGMMTWEDCIKAAVKMGCDGIELLGQLYFRYCPEALQEDIDSWNQMMFDYGVKTICHDFFVDMTMYNHRRLTVKEGVDIIRRHAEFAKKIGCPIIRCGGTATPHIAKAAIPVLEDLGIKMGQELHNGASSYAMPWTQELIEVIEQSGTKYLGVIPDMSMFTKRIGERNIQNGIRRGVVFYPLDMPDMMDLDPIYRRVREKGAAIILGADSTSRFEKYGDIILFSQRNSTDYPLASRHAMEMFYLLISEFYRKTYLTQV